MSITAQHAQEVLDNADLCLGREQISQAVQRLAVQITEKYRHSNPLVLCVMNGGLIFCAELLVQLRFVLQYDYIHATRYQGATRGGQLDWIAESGISLQGRHVLIVDDINDEGLTLKAIVDHCKDKGAASVASVVMVEKQHQRRLGVEADYCGLSVPDRYVFGYGMDYKGYLRNLPEIYAVKE
ncbi:MAG: hypoxanthine-guanine phosphoribosyltransferase [Gammaproteobacteria bacterium]|nr:hypoxanthine-guanine phosphoribosyltransferase [Gammaproteobacteria bacterium]MDH5803022.1 hypoxanthine-guanine phosphoribosyltransferase [Gammaproteobacteria bacterium]